MTAAAPSGVVTFLFTDIQGSTRRWENDADAMRAALLAHDEVLRTAIEVRRAAASEPRANARAWEIAWHRLGSRSRWPRWARPRGPTAVG
jgi:hypothetical protein